MELFNRVLRSFLCGLKSCDRESVAQTDAHKEEKQTESNRKGIQGISRGRRSGKEQRSPTSEGLLHPSNGHVKRREDMSWSKKIKL